MTEDETYALLVMSGGSMKSFQYIQYYQNVVIVVQKRYIQEDIGTDGKGLDVKHVMVSSLSVTLSVWRWYKMKSIVYIVLDILNNIYKDLRYSVEGIFDIAGHYKSALIIILALIVWCWWDKQYDKFSILVVVYILVYITKVVQTGKWKDNMRKKELEKIKKENQPI
jgi:hypothetical protein